jgi:DNA-binding winged helix-turn-helix (wHTH) protein/Tol biopolymer transport system component
MLLKAEGLYVFGPYRLDAHERQLLRDGEPVSLPPRAFDLLLALVARGGSLATKEELLSEVWAGAFVEEVNLSYTVSLLRKALGEEGYIETVPKSGYRFIAPVSVVSAVPAETTLPDPSGVRTRKRSNARWLAALVTPGLLTDSAWTAWKPGFSRSSQPITSGRRWTGVMPWGIAAVALAVAAALAWRSADRQLPTPVYASIDVPAGYVLGESNVPPRSLPTRTPIVFTPDGRSLIIQAARAGKTQLFLHRLDRPQSEARPIAGTDGALVPFVSRDGKWVGFYSANEIRKLPLDGGTATTVCALKAPLGPYGAAWGAADVIVFGDYESRRIMRVRAGGGTPVPVTAQPPSGRRHVAPFFLPDGRRILFSDVSETDASDSRLMVQPLEGGEGRLVIASAADGRLVSSDRLVFMRLGALMSVPFDTSGAEVTGDAVVAMGEVMQSGLRRVLGGNNTAAGMFAVSSLGALAVIQGSLTGPDESRLIWMARDGTTRSAEPANGAPTGRRGGRRISPDGSRAIVSIETAMRTEFWVADWTREAWSACRDCSSSQNFDTAWSPDSTSLLLSRNDTLVKHALDGSTPDRVVVQESGRVLLPSAWRADGRILYQSSPDGANFDNKLLAPGGKTGRILLPLGKGAGPEVSPDGRWLAYSAPSPAPHLWEVIVKTLLGSDSGKQASVAGGRNPIWSPDSRTVYYLGDRDPDGPAGSVFAVDIGASSVAVPGPPRQVLRYPNFAGCTPLRCYDMSPDGQRFLFGEVVPRPSVTRIDLVLNWTTTLPRGR